MTSGHTVALKWADAIVHTSVSLSPSHPRTGLFMAQCMAHKKESTLHNYCLINWPIFYVVSEATDRLQIIWQDLEDVCLTDCSKADLLTSIANLCVSVCAFVCLHVCMLK